MTSIFRRIEIDGDEYGIAYGDAADIVKHPDGETELVHDLDDWLAERTPETDGGSQAFGGGVCPMCGEPYESYTTHMQQCQPDRG